MTKGELNPRAVLTDDDVETIRQLWDSEEGVPKGKRFWTGARLAEKFEISERHVRNIVGYHQRVLGGE